MRRDPIPPVGGTNGETDESDWAEVERRWRTPAPEERIGEARFSLWKVDAPLRASSYRFSPAFSAVVFLASFGLIAVGAWVAGRVRQGDFLLGQIFGIGLFVAVYVGMFVVALVQRRRLWGAAPPGPHDRPPSGLPPNAVACLASVRRRGRCVGWLGFEGDLMVFRGAGFDFRLRREDFRRSRAPARSLRAGPLPMRRPEGVSDYQLFLRPGVIADGAFALDRSLWKTLEADFAAWEGGSFSREPSLFPPIRPVPTLPAPLGWASVVVPPLFMGALLGFAGLVMPIEPTNGRPPNPWWTLALAGVASGLMWPVLLWTSDRTGRTYARQVDRAAAREG